MNITDIHRIDCEPAEYFEIEAVSNSDTGNLKKSPRYYRDIQDGVVEKEIIEAMKFGSAYDSYLLTKRDFHAHYAVAPEMNTPTTDMQVAFVNLLIAGSDEDEARSLAGYTNKRVKASDFDEYVAFSAENADKITISSADFNLVERMADSLPPEAKKIIAEAEKQVVLVGTHEETGLLVKGMSELLWEGMVVDLKTAGVEPSQFRRAFFQRGYDRQLGLYTALAGKEAGGIMACFKHPVESHLYDTTEYLEEGRAKADDLLRQMAWHLTHDKWDMTAEAYMNNGWEAL